MTIQEHYDLQKEKEREETRKKLFAIIDKIMAHSSSCNIDIDKKACGVPNVSTLSRVFE